MATSGTNNYNPSPGEITLYSFQLIGVRPASILQEHLDSARNAMNMMLSNWSNRGVNLWRVSLTTTALVAGQATYSVDAKTVVMLDAYITSGSPSVDRIIQPVSRTEYASFPNKAQAGFPTVYWMDRLLSPTVTLWPAPNGQQTSLKYYSVARIEDANMNGSENVDVPPLWLDAFAYGLAHRLALIWAPERSEQMKVLADEAYQIAASQNVEQANFYVSPTVSSYWR